MFEIKQFTGNTLAISDKQVASEWRLGLLRALGKVATRALPVDTTGRHGSAVEGSAREHVSGNIGVPFCRLVEIYDIREEHGNRFLYSTFGENHDDVIRLTAKATCKCGRLIKYPVSLDITPGTLISEVANTDS